MGTILKNGIPYGVADPDASQVTYSNSSSGLSATNVQSAIDEVGSVRNGTIAYVSAITTAQHRELTRVGNTVQCNFRFTVPSGASSGFTIGTIPSGYRPNVELAFSAFEAWQKDGNVPIVIETSGVVRFLNTLFTVGQSYYLCATWITTNDMPQ